MGISITAHSPLFATAPQASPEDMVLVKVAMSRTGLLRLLKLDLPPSGSPIEVAPSDYVARSLEVSSRSNVIAGVRLGYCKNWTVQTGLETGIPFEHKDSDEQEWLTVVARDSGVAGAYKIFAELPK